jgi:serine protease AprX
MKKIVSIVLAVVLLVAFMPFNSTGVQARTGVIDNKLMEAFSKNKGPLEVIVSFHSKQGPAAKEIKILKDVKISKGVTFNKLPIAGVVATLSQVEKLANYPEVRSIFLNSKLQYDNYDATNLTGAKKVINNSDWTKKNGGIPVSGKGVTVVVNDSGIDGTHKDLEYGSKVIQNVAGATNLNAIVSGIIPVTYTENVPNTDFVVGHGTHVAGIVGGNGAMSSGKQAGVAPGVSLIGYGSGAGLFILDTLSGFDYAISNQEKYGIRVVTNSWGNTDDVGTTFDPNDPTNIATKLCYDNGIVIVFSAGNSGPTDNTITGNFKKAPWVITVAAGDDTGKLTSFSSRGKKNVGGKVTVDGKEFSWVDAPTVTAPGDKIVSTRATADALSAAGLTGRAPAEMPYYTAFSGTSMAAPHVAGIIALMLDANPDLTPDQVKSIISTTATPLPGYEAWEVGSGYVNAYSAVDHAFNEEKNYGVAVPAELTNGNVSYSQLAAALASKAGIRQSTELGAQNSVTTRGGALKDLFGTQKPVIDAASTLDWSSNVGPIQFAYSLVQALGQETAAKAYGPNHKVTTNFNGMILEVKGLENVDKNMLGYIQLAINYKFLAPKYNMTQDGFDITVSAKIEPNSSITHPEMNAAFVNYTIQYKK